MQMTVEFKHGDFQRGTNETQIPDSLLIDKISVRDMYGNRYLMFSVIY